uniref:Sfi1 spindle body domain-containing protein n=2 Tax=Hanusia phi TaxID=3032 RepID=A0A7S0HKM3_9CRYP|mmetsp:Transcript_3001/g.7279  ORF Transcript_3001/g.7279 Transcript_3001/m.7279 type:complete len:399 (+) Transcript_3001:98-1294(+)
MSDKVEEEADVPVPVNEEKRTRRKEVLSHEERRRRAGLLLQTVYRVHLARRVARRRRKLLVFMVETRAVVRLQSFFRMKLAQRRAARKRAIKFFGRFMTSLRPAVSGLGWSEEELEVLAAVLVQSAWRRRQAYFARVRAKGRKGFYQMVKKRRGGGEVRDDELDDLAATFIQTRWRGRQAWFVAMRKREEQRRERSRRAAVRIQARWRGGTTRERVKKQQQQRKMKKLAQFMTQACFIKSFWVWQRHAAESARGKEILGRTLIRMLNRHVYAAFLKLSSYAQHEQRKRVLIAKVAGYLHTSSLEKRNQAWQSWKDFMHKDSERNHKVAQKMAKFLGMGERAHQVECLRSWLELIVKKKQAMWKWKNSVLVQAWRAYQIVARIFAENRRLLGSVRKKWL